MNFLYPTFLWALTALSIPIIIHLFNFRKTNRIYFSNNRFLRQVKEATTAKRKLKHYLILLSRLLFLFFLVITFAQPVIPAREQLADSRNIVLYLDNSLSMSGQIEDRTRGLDAAVGFARDIVELFPPDTRYKLITNDFAPFSNSFKTRAEVLDLLTEIRLSPVSRSMQEVRDRIRLSTERNQEIFWVSDFQKSTAGPLTPNVLDSAVRWHLVPVEFTSKSNVFIDSAYLENPFAAGGEKNVLKVIVQNDGQQDVEQLVLKLTINNIQAGTATVRIPQAGVSEANFDLATGLSGFNKATISFNDFPMSFDNEFYLALNFTDKIRVLEIKSSDEPTPIEKVFGNKEVFSYKGFPVRNFNYSLLSEADLVVVNGLNSIDASLSLALQGFYDNSGTLLIVPGTTPDLQSYKDFLRMSSLAVVGGLEQAELDRPDFNNPFFENVFEEKSVSMAMPKARGIISWGNDRSAILRFKNEQPFLSLVQQSGKLYLLASPLQPEFTDFYNHGLFVPVMYRLAASGRKNVIRPYYTLQESFLTLTIDSLEGEEPLHLVGEQEVVPSQRKVGDRIFLDIPKFSINQGFYNVVFQGDTVSLVAFNLDKDESLMDQYNGEEVKELLGGGDNITLFEASSTEAFSNEIKDRYLGKPLWKYAVMLALFFLLTEILLIRFLK